LKSFLCGNTGHQPGGWFNKEINSVADLQGLKFRMPGFGGKALGLTGASVQALPGGEIYQALASGAIDGAEWIGPFADERMGFQEICKFYYTSGFHEPGSALCASFNLEVYESLSDSHKAVVETAAHATHSWNLAQSNANNAKALDRLKAGGVKVLEFDDSIWEAFGKAAKEAQDGFMDDDLFATIRNSYEASMESTYSWMSMSDGIFAQKRDKFRV
jgi:TRAP-type mannitol/chloroaromatic compound transport system substrate-binding protein